MNSPVGQVRLASLLSMAVTHRFTVGAAQVQVTASFLGVPLHGSPNTALFATTAQEDLFRHAALTLSTEVAALQVPSVKASLEHDPAGVP